MVLAALSAVYRPSARPGVRHARGERPDRRSPLAPLGRRSYGRACEVGEATGRSKSPGGPGTGPSGRGAQEGGRGCRCPSRASLRWALPGLRDDVGRLGVRAMRQVFLVFVLVGYVVALVPARRCHLDIGSFRRALWVGYGSRDAWLPRSSSPTSCSRGRHWWSRSRGAGARPGRASSSSATSSARCSASRNGPARRGSAATAGVRRRPRTGRHRSGVGSAPATLIARAAHV